MPTSAKSKLKNIYPVREHITTGHRSVSVGYNVLRKFSNGVFWTIFTFVLLLPVSSVFAQDTVGTIPAPPCKSGELCNPIKANSIGEFLTATTKAFITIAFPIVVLMIIYSGFLFVAAQGNEEKLKTAKRTIVWTIIGGLIVLAATVLVNVISGTVTQITT